MKTIIESILSKKSFAVIGSFKNEQKFAYMIVQRLKRNGYAVYPVNPTVKEVEGLCCYKTLLDIPCPVDVASIITPPQVTETIVRQCLEKGIKQVWIQPGAESCEAVTFCHEHNIEVISGGDCLLVMLP